MAAALPKRQRQADLSKTISQQWRSLSKEERKYWDDLAKQKKREHEEMFPVVCLPAVARGGRCRRRWCWGEEERGEGGRGGREEGEGEERGREQEEEGGAEAAPDERVVVLAPVVARFSYFGRRR